ATRAPSNPDGKNANRRYTRTPGCQAVLVGSEGAPREGARGSGSSPISSRRSTPLLTAWKMPRGVRDRTGEGALDVAEQPGLGKLFPLITSTGFTPGDAFKTTDGATEDANQMISK